ncbi:hypothetical protein TWF694_007586 [Orbilia ellipsospora]|uniref:ASX DEUBAD domain-containing protein n=1 Tax=Orbilia ellipsospora TaxID=2528407 RepID=A0AAV9XI68_9PEZI
MVQRKRTAGTAAKRKSTRNQSTDPDVNTTKLATPEPHQEQTQPSPRKRSKTDNSTLKSNKDQDDTLLGEPTESFKAPVADATSLDNATQNTNALGSSQDPAKIPQPQLSLDIENIEKPNASPPDTTMRDESPTDEVSLKLEEVDIQTPRKVDQPVSVRAARSTRSRAKESTDVDITDELLAVATPGPTRRSTRAHKPKQIYDEEQVIDAAPQLKKPQPQKQSAKPKPTGKPAKTGVWSSQHLLTSKRSKIINAECNAIFNESTWGLFTDEEKEHLLSLLHPIDKEITIPDQDPSQPPPRIPSPLLWQNLNNDAFRSAFVELQDDLSTGAYEPAYVKKAEEALRQRLGPMADKVDDMKNKEFEEYWGQKQAVFFGDAGLSANITLYELCQQKMFKPGDIFEYKRSFQKTLVVEKICELVKVELSEDGPSARKRKDACTLTFRYPSGTSKFLAGNHDEDAPGEELSEKIQERDVTIQVNNLAQLEVAILDEDGTVKASDPEKYKQYPNANSWKQFMVRRNDEFLGSTFMMRQHYYEKSAAKQDVRF